MKKRLSPKKVLILIIFLVLALLIIFGNKFLFGVYQDTASFFSSIFNRSFDYQRFSDLQLENQRLKLEIERLTEESLTSNDFDKKTATVYSKYPFSGRDKVIISLGSKEGIAEGMPVLNKGFLLGKVISVSNHQSEVQTIFDSNWKNSVGVGDYYQKAVLEGGSNPAVTLIPKDSDVDVGDQVFNLAPDYPIYQIIGTISDIDSSAGELWNSGVLETPYKLNEIKNVEVILDFP